MAEPDPIFIERLTRLGRALLTALDAFELTRRRLHPPAIGALRDALQPFATQLDNAVAEFSATPVPEGLGDVTQQLAAAATTTQQALAEFCAPALPHEAIARVLGAMHRHC